MKWLINYKVRCVIPKFRSTILYRLVRSWVQSVDDSRASSYREGCRSGSLEKVVLYFIPGPGYLTEQKPIICTIITIRINQTNILIWIFDMKYGYRPSGKGASDYGRCPSSTRLASPPPPPACTAPCDETIPRSTPASYIQCRERGTSNSIPQRTVCSLAKVKYRPRVAWPSLVTSSGPPIHSPQG